MGREAPARGPGAGQRGVTGAARGGRLPGDVRQGDAVRAEEIRDRETLEAWLKDQPRAVAVTVSTRAALRALPGAAWFFEMGGTRDRARVYALTLFRCALASMLGLVRSGAGQAVRAAAASSLTDQMEDAANVAYDLSQGMDDAFAAHVAVRAVLRAVQAASGRMALETWPPGLPDGMAGAEVWGAVRWDCRSLGARAGAGVVSVARLWPNDPPEETVRRWAALAAALRSHSRGWEFWIDWYEDVVAGRVQNWVMLEEIAAIPEADWAQGSRHVNALIAEIVARHRAGGAGPAAETLAPAAAVRLQAQVTFLLQSSACAEVTAQEIAGQIGHAITVYKREEQCNDLPDHLQIFQHMADTLERLSRTVVRARDDPDQVAALKQQIVDLEAQIETLTARLRVAEHRDDFRRFWDAGVESAGRWAGPAMMGGIVWFVNSYVDPGTLNQLGTELTRWAQAVRGVRG